MKRKVEQGIMLFLYLNPPILYFLMYLPIWNGKELSLTNAAAVSIIFFVFQSLSLAIAILQLLLKKFGNNDSCLLALVSAFFMIGSFMITSFVGLAFILNLFDISLIPPQD